MIKYSVFLMIIIGLAACGEEDAYPLKVKFVIVNASPDAPALNVFIDNNNSGSPVSFPNYSHLDINAGKRHLKIGPSDAESFFDSTLYLVENRNYSLYFINALDTIEAVLRRDTLILPAIGKAKLRFIHLSPDAPAVSFAAYGQTDTLDIANQLYKNFPAFAEVDSGIYELGVTINGNGSAVSISDTLATGKVYTVFLHGFRDTPAGGPRALGLSIIENN